MDNIRDMNDLDSITPAADTQLKLAGEEFEELIWQAALANVLHRTGRREARAGQVRDVGVAITYQDAARARVIVAEAVWQAIEAIASGTAKPKSAMLGG